MLREVAKAKFAAELWLKLESLYMTKSLANRLHKKIKLYTFKMTLDMSIEEHLDHFNKIILDLENIDIAVSDKDKAILLLTSLDALYTNMKEVIMYGRDSLIFDEVQSILHARELQKQEESKEELGEGLNIRGKSEKREKKGNNSKSRSKSRTKKFNVEVLNVAEVDSGKEWILDSRCSFRMCPIKAWFEDFKEADGGHVLLGNNKHCKILGTGTVRIKHYEGIERVLEDVRPDYDKQSFYYAEGGCGDNQAMVLEATRVKFAKAVHETQNQLDYIHSDLWGPSRVPSIGGARLPKVFWAEAIETIVHLINKSPSSALQFKTPQGKWTKKAADINISKFLGVKGYKLWIETQGKEKCIISRNVTFNEQDMLKQTLTKDMEGLDQLQFEVGHETLQPEKSKETSSKTVQEEIVRERQDEPTQGLESYSLARDKQKRQVKPPKRYGQVEMTTFALSVAEEIVDMEPKTYQEVINSNEADQWVKAIQKEIDSLRKNETWELVTKPKDQKVVKRKQGTLGNEAPRYKARLVAKGFSQKEGVDHNEILSLVVKHSSIRLLLAFVAHEDLELDQLDVKITFLHGKLDELIYMQPPEGFGEGIKDGQVCLLKKSLYGLNQSPRQWYKRFDKYMLDISFNRSSHDGCVYFKLTEDSMIYLLLYVDDMLVACKEKKHLELVKEMLKDEFEIKDLGLAKRILGMKIERDRSKRVFRLSQKSYISKTHEEKRFMERILYASMVGSVMYTMVCSRPDLAYAVSMISRYMSCLGKPHWQVVKWLFQYLGSTRSLGLVYGGNSQLGTQLQGFVDADYVGNIDTRKSLTGYVFTMFGRAVS
ncbi:Retrovirus-related Pol polyprotein from transposon TNT 1-94 [Vitis vinifera]|uniref:Retrovirus-related Pol polyprotein from transposon TNT 1-94 n=1 Tax=Vitis vinifera TaxID=29760 RepID=A0A438E0U9_VITVI|nr:Retrovirus-related Pol polyprotein from transposon TNT 1-94 [Vitis vinifera]